MADTLIRTAYSPIFSDQNDFSTALFTSNAELMSQNIGCPVHLAAMPASVKEAFKEFSGELDPGDVILLNDPFRGGTHTWDYTFMSPLFIGDELVALTATRAHIQDAGECTTCGLNRVDVLQEGLRIPPVKLYSRGKPVRDVLKLILSHTRLPDWLEGDIRAAIASNEAGKKFLESLYRKYGRDLMEVSVEEILDYAERGVRKAISKMPEGAYSAEDFADTDHITPEPVRFKATITVKGDEMVVDWTGTSPPTRGCLNRPKQAAIGDTMYALKTLLDPKGPANSGWFRPIKVIIPENSLLDAKWPSPVEEGNLETTARMTDVIWQALAPIMPDKVEAMTYGCCTGVGGVGIDPRTNRPYSFYDMPPGGWGGRSSKDGWNAVWHLLGNCRDLQIETSEAIFPIRVAKRELIRDSGGPGKYRGGLALAMGYKFLNHQPNNAFVEVARTMVGPPGIFGGKSGRPGRAVLTYPNGKEEIIYGLREDGSWVMQDNVPFPPPNSAILLEPPGGGGYGDPLERDPRMVLEDVLDEYISLESGKKDYGVVIDQNTFQIDHALTEKLRRELKKQK